MQQVERTEAEPHSVIQVEEVFFKYGDRTVLDGISLRLSRGEIFGILGANGAGKTTLIRLLLGLLKPQSGSIFVLGERPSPALTHRIGYMPQSSALYLELPVLDNVGFFARMFGLDDRAERGAAVKAALDVVALWDRRKDPLTRLSGGMRQRVSLAVALVHKPPLLILDEPTVGLDPELRASFWEHFRTLVTDGTTLLLSSHTMDDAAHCDHLGFIQDGHIIAEGSPAELRAATGKADTSLEEAFLHFVRRM